MSSITKYHFQCGDLIESSIKKKSYKKVLLSIANIKDDETYQVIESISDWGDYFDEIERNLREELNNLERASTVT